MVSNYGMNRLNYKGDLKSSPTLVTGDGDGTVNIRSLKSCERWSGTQVQGPKTVHSIEVPGADHMGILNDKRVVQYVLQLLTDDPHYNVEETNRFDSRILRQK